MLSDVLEQSVQTHPLHIHEPSLSVVDCCSYKKQARDLAVYKKNFRSGKTTCDDYRITFLGKLK